MTNVNTVISDRNIDRAAMLRLYEDKTVGKVMLVIDGHSIRVDKLIKASTLQGKSFNTFLSDLDKEIVKTMGEAYTTSSNDMIKLFQDQSSFTTSTLHKTISDVWRVEAPPRHVAAEVVLNTPIYQNKTLAVGWAGIGQNEKIRIEAIIRQGIAEGQSTKAIADTVLKEGYKVTKNQANGLVVTASTHVYSEADHQVYKMNEKALQGWQYVAVLDSRTTPLCSHLDGQIFPISDTEHLPPRHWYCRSTTLPIVKSYEDLAKLEGVAQIRKRNLVGLTPKEVAFYDGQSPMRESYNEWLKRQPTEVQLRHLGDTKKLELFRGGQLTVDQFTKPTGESVSPGDLNRLTDSGLGVPGDSRRFAIAKEKLDTLKLGAARPEEIYENPEIRKALEEYYLLQAGELDGTLSITNYRGTLIHNKKNTKNRVLTSPPTEEQLKFNPVNGRYEDVRMYQPNPAVFTNTQRLVSESVDLKQADKDFIIEFSNGLKDKMSINERAVVTENLRITMERFRKDAQPWGNLKAVLNNEMKFDVMNVSNYMETQIRKDADLLTKLKQLNYLDPVLGPTQLSTLSDDFLKNIFAKNTWEDRTAPRIGKELRNILDLKIPYGIRSRLTDGELDKFYLSFAKRLGFADTPDRDQLAVQLGRDLYNKANRRGSRNEWFNLGVKILDDAKGKGFYELETYGVQKRRMKSKMGGNYFGPYYDTFAVNVRVVDPRLLNYAKLSRKVDLGYRIGVTDANPKNRLVIREGYKTYFVDNGVLGYVDTRIPITSSSSFVNFPATAIDKNMADALNWAANSKYRVDPDFFDFSQKLLAFQDDKGKAKYYNDLNVYRTHIVERGDSYERFKAMQWFRNSNAAFSNHPFLDHRARIYDSGLIGPQSGETFRPYLSTEKSKILGVDGFLNLQDQIGAFLGGASDKLEGKYNSLSIKGRQQIAIQQRESLIKLGDMMRRGKPNDIRGVLEHPLMAEIDGEEQGKLMRLALEMSKINEHLDSNFANLKKMETYATALALEQDASSSGAQIIALTTKNKQLAELSNVVPTNQKQRLYDEIAASTFNDPRFIELNKKLNLTEKDLRKGAKQQNMVTLYGAGARTGILAVESKVGKILDKSIPKPLAIIVKGNAERISSAGMDKSANKFYDELKKTLEAKGYRVEFDDGLPNTVPNQKAALWVGHSRGIDRLKFAEGPETIALETADNLEELKKQHPMAVAYDLNTKDPNHYKLSANDLARIDDNQPPTGSILVVKASDRDQVLGEISARMARYEKIDPDMYLELKALRQDVKDTFNKGLAPGDAMMEDLQFLDPKSRELVEKLGRSYDQIVTPSDFQQIAMIMSEKLAEQVPILKTYTKTMGRLAQEFMLNAKPSDSDIDTGMLLKTLLFGAKKKGTKLPSWLNRIMGIKDEAIREKFLRRIPGYVPGSLTDQMLTGVVAPTRRRTGFKIGKYSLFSEDITKGIEIGIANKLEKKWTNVPWVNFDKVTLEQNYTQTFEQKLMYKDKDGKWITNILQVDQKTDPTWWEEFRNKQGKINDIADDVRVRTAYGVSGNHSNDATIVKNYHLWGRKANVATSTIHDAFFANAADMTKGREALREIMAKTLDSDSLLWTLNEMRARGLPKEIYDKYLKEMIDQGLIPVAGKSVVGGKLMRKEDILTKEMMLVPVKKDFTDNRYFYGVG